MDIIIVGGGVSGLIAAINLKKSLNKKSKIIVLERLEKIGKKILATGNGKCNFTNTSINSSNNYKNIYNNPKFVSETLNNYDSHYVIKYLENLGLYSKELSEGRIYPYTEQASTFLDILRLKLNSLGVEIRSNFEVNKITKKDDKFQVYNKNQRAYYLEGDAVILATGGCSAEILGSNGSGYTLAKGLKIKTSKVYPGLVGLLSDPNILKPLNGLRIKSDVNLYNKKIKKNVYSEFGEVQFKNDGLSGIVIMNISNYIAHNEGTYTLYLDLFNNHNLDELKDILKKRQVEMGELEVSNLLTGIVPKMIGSLILKKASIDMSLYIKDLTTKNITKIAGLIKALPFDVKGTYGFDKSQISIGGIELSEVDPTTFWVKKIEGLYAVGELLNVDGKCGGYNFHWAIASALACSDSIKQRGIKNVTNKKH